MHMCCGGCFEEGTSCVVFILYSSEHTQCLGVHSAPGLSICVWDVVELIVYKCSIYDTTTLE